MRSREKGRWKVSDYTVKEAKWLLRGDVWKYMHTTTSKTYTTKRVDIVLAGRGVRVYYVDNDGVGGYTELPNNYSVYVINRVQVVEGE